MNAWSQAVWTVRRLQKIIKQTSGGAIAVDLEEIKESINTLTQKVDSITTTINEIKTILDQKNPAIYAQSNAQGKPDTTQSYDKDTIWFVEK